MGGKELASMEDGLRTPHARVDHRDMNVFVINAGSSSLKFQVVAPDLERIRQDDDELLGRGQVERIGGQAIITVQNRAGFRQS